MNNAETKELPNFRDMIRDGLTGPCKREAIEFGGSRIAVYQVAGDQLDLALEKFEGKDAMGFPRWRDVRVTDKWIGRFLYALIKQEVAPTQLDIA